MNNNSIGFILASCETVRKIKEELNKTQNFYKIISRLRLKKYIKRIHDYIDQIQYMQWDIETLKHMHVSLRIYNNELKPYLEKEKILITNNESVQLDQFNTMYFEDGDNQIMLDLIADNIKYTDYNLKTGRKFSSLSSNISAGAQKYMENICKKKIINALHNYLENI